MPDATNGVILALTVRELNWLDDICLKITARYDDEPAHTLLAKINAIKFPTVPCGPAENENEAST